MTRILTDDERRLARANGLAASLTRMCRTLSGYGRLRVTASSGAPDEVPAYTQWIAEDLPTITLNTKYMRFDSNADYVQSVALGFHELAHVIYTPSQYSLPMERACAEAYNIAEDARIEHLLIGMYPSTQPYLTALIARLIITTTGDYYRDSKSRSKADEDEAKRSVYPLTVGRKYLPAKLRDKAKAEFIATVETTIPSGRIGRIEWADHRVLVMGTNPTKKYSSARVIADEMAELLDEYLTLVLPGTSRNQERCKALVKTFQSMLDAVKAHHADGNHHQSAQAGAAGQSAGRGRGVKGEQQASEEAQQQAQQAAQQKADQDAADGADGSGKGDDQGDGVGDAQDGADGDGGQDGQGNGSDGDGNGPQGDGGSGDKSGSKGGGAGSTSDHGPVFADAVEGVDDLAGMAEALIETAVNDYGRAAADMTHEQTRVPTLMPRQTQLFDPSAEVVMASLAYERQIKRLTDDVEPGWNRRQSSGRLNVGRAMTGETPIDELFDMWDEGRIDDTRTETVILVDASGSMDSVIRDVMSSAWGIKRAADKLRHQCTVLAFNTEGAIVWPAAQRVPTSKVPYMDASGGTAPHGMLVKAAEIFDASKLKHKILVVLTDGSWDDHHRSQPVVARITASGVITVLVRYSTWGQVPRIPGFSATVDATGPSTLGDVAKAAVTSRVERTVRARH